MFEGAEPKIEQERDPKQEIQQLLNTAIEGESKETFSDAPIKAEQLMRESGYKPEDFGVSEDRLSQLTKEHSLGVINEAIRSYENGDFERAVVNSTKNLSPYWRQVVVYRLLETLRSNVGLILTYLEKRFGYNDPDVVLDRERIKTFQKTLFERSWRNPFEEK